MPNSPTLRAALRVALALALLALPTLALGAPQDDPAAADAAGVPDWFSVLPPLLAIVVALAFRNVIPALFAGIWLGAWGAAGLGLEEAFVAVLDSFQVFVLGALTDPSDGAGRLQIVMFSLMIGGMVGVVMRNGGMQGIVDSIADWTNTRRRGQLATSWLGLGIFFDDYANSMVVGNTMRPITDRLKVSREKLAYLVDSTAAPVACVAFVTTWIGMEVGLIDAELTREGIDAGGHSAYEIFLSSLRFSFYPLLAMAFVLLVSYTGRDFGPMLAAERRALTDGGVARPGAKIEAAEEKPAMRPIDGKPRRPVNAVLPILVLLSTVLIGMWVTGRQSTLADGGEVNLRNVIGNADSYAALMWGSLLGVLTAAALSMGQRILTLDQTVDAWYEGLKAMLYAIIVLVLAWGLGAVTSELGTGAYLGELIRDNDVGPAVLPAATFLLAAAIAFATGTSWGTMGILMPIVFPVTWGVLLANGSTDPGSEAVLLSAVSCVLAGAVWGDHCSPISDTTILSSMVSSCDHIDHVRTQLPYALLVGGVSLVAGTIPTAFGMPWWLGLLLGFACLAGLLRLIGQRADEGVA